MEALLRPPIEWWASAASLSAAAALLLAPGAFSLPESLARISALLLAARGVWRGAQGVKVVRYQRRFQGSKVLRVRADAIPQRVGGVYLGSGFRWTQRHTQRLKDAFSPHAAKYVRNPAGWGQWLMLASRRRAHHSSPGQASGQALHAVGLSDKPVYLERAARVGHVLVLGSTRVGKTRLAELLITQDIRHGDTVIVFDPKGDKELLQRMQAEAQAARRDFFVFHLGFPQYSARYNAIGNFARITEVATRIANQLPTEGNSMAFREFAWRFVNVIARALVALDRRPDYTQIRRFINDIDPLFIEYARQALLERGPEGWEERWEDLSSSGSERNSASNERGRAKAVIGLIRLLEEVPLDDPVLEGLLSAARYERTYFDKVVASVGPLMDKLTTGPAAELIAPDYFDEQDDRPIFEWLDVIRRGGVVYVGLDALSDMTVASAVGNSMFADLVSVAGHLYKDTRGPRSPRISVHADEFAELVGDEFIPLLNKAGGAGFGVVAYTQTWSDVEARFGSRAKAGQVAGNFNSLIMLRVKDLDTAQLLTDQLRQVEVVALMSVSGVDDSSEPESGVDFRSRNEDRISLSEVPLLAPAELVSLPKGEAFALLEGGTLWKLKLPLMPPAADEPLEATLRKIRDAMPRTRGSASAWYGRRLGHTPDNAR